MKSFFIGLYFFTLSGFLFAQQAKSLKGFVRNSEMQTLSFTTIHIVQSNQIITANEHGAFTIQVNIGDSLIISRLSYETDTVVITKAIFYESQLFNIFLKRKIKILKDVNVSGRSKNDSLAKAFAEFMKHDTLLNNQKRAINIKQMAQPKLSSIGIGAGFGIGVEGLINSIWYKTSAKGRSNEKLLKLVELYNQSLKIDDKLSISFIMKTTGVDEKKADWIKNNCAKSILLKKPNFNEYELILVLRQCAE